jgi:hypothetical protein
MKKKVKPEPIAKPRAKISPKPELLRIKGNCETAVTRSFKKKKPVNGWPK